MKCMFMLGGSGFAMILCNAPVAAQNIPIHADTAVAVSADGQSITNADKTDPRAALFRSSDPVLDARKQVVYHIITEIFEGGRIDLFDEYLTERYIQHNPNIGSGRETIKAFFRNHPLPITGPIPVIAVVAEGDMIVVASDKILPHPEEPGKTYTVTHFEMWRFVGNKVDEHWDETLFGPPPSE